MIRRVLLGLAAFVLLLLGIGLYRGEWIREENDTGYSSAALRDPLLAARRFLERHGHRTRNIEVLGVGLSMPPKDGVLLFLASRLALTDGATKSLADWVDGGGHLVTLATAPSEETLYGRDDALLRELGITAKLPAPEEMRVRAGLEKQPEYEPRFDFDGCMVTPRLEMQLDAPRERLAIATTSALRLQHAPGTAASAAVKVLASDGFGAFAYTAPYGRGRVTVLADPDVWFNGEIGCLDHAHFLLRIVEQRAHVWTVAMAERPTLFTLLRREGVALLLAAGALLALWLWSTASRFGPILPSPEPARRARAEAVRATGEYLWRMRAVADLLAGLRARVHARARRRFGNEQAIAALARRARVDTDRAVHALQTEPRTERELIATTRTLKELIEQS